MTKEDMHNFGYMWDGMFPLTKEGAVMLHDVGYPIFLLHSDNTESLVRECCEIYEHEGMFGMAEGFLALSMDWIEHLAGRQFVGHRDRNE